ncbi:MAG: hypothetical protein AAB653_02155 [Patescibacteria group bacterium]
MILFIDTIKNNKVTIVIKDNNKQVAVKRFFAQQQQAEKLLLAIDKLLISKKIKLKDLKKIEVENRGGLFTSLRVGVTVANSLGYALGIPVVGLGGKTLVVDNNKKFSVVKPIYNSEPRITIKKIRK